MRSFALRLRLEAIKGWQVAAAPGNPPKRRVDGKGVPAPDSCPTIDMNTKKSQINEFLESVLDSVPIPIFYQEMNGLFLCCNAAFESFFGLSRKSLAGKSAHEVFDKEGASNFRAMDIERYRKPGKQVYESTVLDAKGLKREVIFHEATFLNPQGEVAGIIGAVLDATELKATERKLFGAKTSFNLILDSLPDLLSVVDKDMRIIYSNWHGGHEYVTQDLRSKNPHCYDAFYPGQGKPCDPCHLVEVLRTGKTVITEKYNPRIGYLEVHAFPVLDESGNVILAVDYLHDITERKQAGFALQQANHMLEAIIDASPLAIIALDTDDNLTLWNHAAEEMFGWKREEVICQQYPIIPEDRIDEVKKNFRQMHRGEVCRSQETRRRRKDGSLVDVSLSTAVMSGPAGELYGYMAIMSDITEHNRAQQDLRESEANYRAIFDAANDAIFVLDIETGEILDVNRKLCEMYGYPREKVLRLKLTDLSSGETPFTQENFVKKINKVRNHRSHLFEWVAKDSSGRHFWVEVNMRGAVIGGDYKALAVVRDITERKQAVLALRESEERFRQIFEEDEDAALILAPQTFHIVDANVAAARLYGYSKKELRNNTPALFMAMEEYRKFRDTFAIKDIETSSKARLFKIDRVDIVSKNKRSIVASVRGKIIRSQGKYYLHCTFRDITENLSIKEERKRFEEKLIQANKMTALGTLASGIAHEINNPNNYILSSSQFLHEAWKDIEQILREYGKENGEYNIGGLPDNEATEVIPKLLASLEEGSSRIKNNVENLKSFARQEKESCHTILDVNVAVNASINLLGNQIRKYTDNFYCNLDEKIPKVEGSLQQVEQVVINLTMNALQSLPNKNAGVFISTFYERTTHQVVIRVRDQGTGIPQELLRRIMEPFFTTKQDVGGTGLGLSICFSIIKKHQGTIECESGPNLGTIFSVRLPVYGAHL